MRKCLFDILLLLCITAGLLVGLVSATPVFSGEGTADNPYLIADAEDLLTLATTVNNGQSYAGKHFKLTSSIDLTNVTWTPIGTAANPFLGSLDGYGNTIGNLTLATTADNAGLFGSLGNWEANGGAIENLTLKNITIQCPDANHVGALAGTAYAHLSNIHVRNATISGKQQIGGLVGSANNSTITDCFVQADITGRIGCTGGIAGTGYCTIQDCCANIDLICSWAAGGIIGESNGSVIKGNYVTGTLACCDTTHTAEAAVHDEVTNVGGIVGSLTQTNDQMISGNYCNAVVQNDYHAAVGDFPILGSYACNATAESMAQIKGNSWNRVLFDTDTVGISGLPEITLTRNSNLIAVESDLHYLNATDISAITILSYATDEFTPVSYQAVQAAVDHNLYVAFLDTNHNGSWDTAEDRLINLSQDIANVPASCTIVLTRDSTLTAPLVIGAQQQITLDLAGCVLSSDFAAPMVDVLGSLTVTDTKKNGKIISSNGDGIATQGAGSLTIHSGEIGAAKLSVSHTSSGTLQINGGKIHSTRTALQIKAGGAYISGSAVLEGKAALAVINPNNVAYAKIDLAITDGSFYGALTSTAPNGGIPVTGFITGGLYSMDVIFYCADGYATNRTEDGLYAIKNYGCSYGGACTALFFRDISSPGGWDHAGIDYVYNTTPQLMNGTSADTFAPEASMTRAQIVTVLYRAAGSPTVNTTNPFTDCIRDSYYNDAVTWAVQSGITNGISDTTFAPETNVTRQQVAAFLYRYANYAGADTTVTGELDQFPDAAQVSPYAETPMCWAVGSGLINGVKNNTTREVTLNPEGNATRAQLATIIMRFMENIN